MEVKIKDKKCRNCGEIVILDVSHPYKEFCCRNCLVKFNQYKYNHRYYLKNKALIRERVKGWRENNSEKLKNYCKMYALKNLSKLKKYQSEWRSNNKDKKDLIDKRYRLNNRERVLLNVKNRHKVRYLSDVNYRLRYLLRRRLQTAIKKQSSNTIGVSKYGLNYKSIIEHLKPFPEDIHKYHIDHIIPLCSFDLTDPEQVKKAFAPENHQWLLAKDNLSKGGKYEK